MQNSLRKHGVPWTPVEKLALTALVGTRDPSVAAQIPQVFASMDKATQANVQKQSAVVVKAATKLDREAMAGITPPTGFWDPLKITTDMPDGVLYWAREVELKHGRLGMLAALGFLVAEQFHPLFGGNCSPNPLLALTQVPKLGWLQILTFIMFMEVIGILNSRRPDYEPGNFLGTSQWEMDETWDSYQTKELNNGRLAMFAAAGIIAQEMLTGKKILPLNFN